MELKAENRYYATEELFKEGMERVVADEYRPIAKKAVIAVAAVWLILAAVTLHLRGHFVFILIELAVSVFVCCWLWVIVPRNQVRRSVSYRQRTGGDTDRKIEFYEDRLEADRSENDEGLIINYEDVVKVLETPNLLILMSANHTGVMVSKTGFTKGDETVVRELLKEWSR